MKKVYKVSILGGTDGFGKWLCEYILREFPDHVSITITGRNKDKWEWVAKNLGVFFTDDNISAVKNADIVIYSVPISKTRQTIEETLEYIKSWAIVSDVTSIKTFPSIAMSKRDDLVVIPTHPMFGPYISSIAWQVCVLTANTKNQNTREYIFLKDFLNKKKVRVREESPDSHDKMMAVVQWLTHLNMFVVWETIKRLGFKVSESMDFISPIYKLMISSVWRYLWQNPWLYADIQMYNEQIIHVHENFLDTAKNFHNTVQNKDVEKFCSDIISAREFFEEENCSEWQEYTDKVIYLLWKQLELLKDKLGHVVHLKNIYTCEEVSGKLLDFDEKEISLQGKKVSYLLNNWEVLS